MSSLIKHACMLTLALPAAALADPVNVTTHSTGTTTVDNTILSALGLNNVPDTALLPYALALDSTFDTETNPLSSNGWAYDGGKVAVDFRIGSQAYRYDGIANSSVHRYAQSGSVDSYEQHIWFNTEGDPSASYTVHFYNTLYGVPGGTSPEDPLAPFGVDESQGVYGYYTINAYPGNPDVPLSWSMGASGATLSVQVSAVPEPASFALLAAGLLALGLFKRAGGLYLTQGKPRNR